MDDNFQPLIIALCCNWCSYAGADLAGVSRTQYPPSIRIVRVMCSGMVHPNLVIDALPRVRTASSSAAATMEIVTIRRAITKQKNAQKPSS